MSVRGLLVLIVVVLVALATKVFMGESEVDSSGVSAYIETDVCMKAEVDHDKPMAQVVRGYDSVHKDITDHNFPTKQRGKKQTQFMVLGFGGFPTSDFILGKVSKFRVGRFRPPEPREMDAFAEVNPGIESKYKLVSLHPDVSGEWIVSLCNPAGSTEGKKLALSWFNATHNPETRFLWVEIE